jgi:hypothetical protein
VVRTTAAGRNDLRGADNLTTHSYKAGSGRMIPYEKWVEPEHLRAGASRTRRSQRPRRQPPPHHNRKKAAVSRKS